MSDDTLFLGLDLSTQSASSLAVTAAGKVVHRESINFDKELPSYGTTSGMCVKDGSVVTSPAGMWLDALDLLFSRIDKAVLDKIKAVSASAQQHGSVYWGESGRRSLQNMDPAKSLKDNILSALVLEDCPIWADSSTEKQCTELEEKLGGGQAVADATGSRAYPRFTGNQIAKIAEEQPAKWGACERVSLVSSFVSSLLIGDYAPIDDSDGSGMNLMDLRSKKWHAAACTASAPGLPEKLGPDPVPSSSVLGTIAKFWVDKYGLPATCSVVCCSGDNPNSIVGMGLLPGEVAVSLGTSDTLMGVSYTPTPRLDGHLMVHPTFPGAYFAMLVYKNGAGPRTAVRDAACQGSWAEFEAQLRASPAANGGKLALHVPLDEITPRIVAKGVHREGEAPFSAAAEVRAVVEGRALSMRLHAAEVGIRMPPAKVLLTGGSAENRQVCQVMADVLGCAVEVHAEAVADSAALGAALRARDAAAAAGGPGTAGAGGRAPLREVAAPDPAATAQYEALLPRFAAFEARVAAMAAENLNSKT